MCKFFSANIDKNKKVYWKRGKDSHSDIQKIFKLKEPVLGSPPTNQEIAEKIQWAKVEIVPKKDYLDGPDRRHWKFTLDEAIKPVWWNKSYEKLCWEAWEKAVKMYDEFNWKEVKNPILPFKIKAPKITKTHIGWLNEWVSVRGSVWDSVWDSVRDSVGDSVWGSVWGSVRDSVWDSVGAYIGSLFPNIKKWKYVDYRKRPFNKIKGYPFRSGEKLWRVGLVPVYYDGKWKLYGSPKGDGKCKVVWEGK